jgi:hypothetical protein
MAGPCETLAHFVGEVQIGGLSCLHEGSIDPGAHQGAPGPRRRRTRPGADSGHAPQSPCKRSPSMRQCSDFLRGSVCSSIWDPFCPSVAQRSRGPLDSACPELVEGLGVTGIPSSGATSAPNSGAQLDAEQRALLVAIIYARVAARTEVCFERRRWFSKGEAEIERARPTGRKAGCFPGMAGWKVAPARTLDEPAEGCCGKAGRLSRALGLHQIAEAR